MFKHRKLVTTTCEWMSECNVAQESSTLCCLVSYEVDLTSSSLSCCTHNKFNDEHSMATKSFKQLLASYLIRYHSIREYVFAWLVNQMKRFLFICSCRGNILLFWMITSALETQTLCRYWHQSLRSLLLFGHNMRDRIETLTQRAECRVVSIRGRLFSVIWPKVAKLQPFETKLR